MTTNFIDELLQQAKEKEEEAYKSVEVTKNVDLLFDIGTMTVTDPNELDVKQLRADPEDYLRNLARDDVQLIINKMWDLPTHRVDGCVVAKLPAPTSQIPRVKPAPKPRAPTKWESYAKEKGISSRKKEKLVYDDTNQEWKPRYGYNRIGAEKDDWLMEVPEGKDDSINYFDKKSGERKERVAKNELQRLRNIARGNKFKITGANLTPVSPSITTFTNKEDVVKAVSLAKASTASLGKFEQKLKHERAPKNSGKKRQFEPNIGDLKSEKEKNLGMLENLAKKVPKIDIKKAVGTFINKEEKTSSETAKKGTRGKKGPGSGRKPRKEYSGKNFKGGSKRPPPKGKTGGKGRPSGGGRK
jgi:regulator of ribosome biosynthesis